MKKTVISCVAVLGVCVALADAPVIDLSQQPDSVPTGTTLNANGAPVQNMPMPTATQPVASVVNTPTTAGPAPTVPSIAQPSADEDMAVPSVDTSSLPLNDRVARLEQQLKNLVSMNLPQQITELQQQVAQLRGQLQVQSHDLKLLNQQQRTFYQDLDGRIKQLNSLNSNDNGASNTNSSSKMNSDVLDSSQASLKLKESSAFQEAIDSLGKKLYPKAINQLQQYLSNYPNGHYVANAHYWLGDIYFMQKNNDQATKEFVTLTQSYPTSSKVPDAKLKLAIIHANDGQVKEARNEFVAIRKEHPNSTAAQLANIRLQQLDAQN